MKIKDIYQPKTIKEALSYKATTPKSNYIAGGTDLIIDLRKNKIDLDYLIDLNNVTDLKYMIEKDKNIEIGPLTTFSDLKNSSLIAKYAWCLKQCSDNMGSPQIRNKATIGGNIINAGAAADSIPCLIALDCILVIVSLFGERKISCEDYFKNYVDEKLQDNELLVKIIIPKKQQLTGFYKLGKRNSLSIARINTAVAISFNNNIITNFNVSLGAVGRYPFKSNILSKLALNKEKDWIFSDEVLDLMQSEVYNSINGRKTMPFKSEAIRGVYKEALICALQKGCV